MSGFGLIIGTEFFDDLWCIRLWVSGGVVWSGGLVILCSSGGVSVIRSGINWSV